MYSLKKIVENYLHNCNQKYIFFDKDGKYEKFLIKKKIEKYVQILEKFWKNSNNNGVAIALDRNIDYICVIFATWICKGYYLPLSTKMPKKNRNYQIKDSGVNLLVFKKKDKIFFKKIKRKKIIFPNFKNKIAYIIFTSGSTGKKKGVCISNDNLISYYNSIKNKFKKEKHLNSVLINGEFTFDITIADLIFALVFKASIGVTDNARNFISLISMAYLHRVESIYLVPSSLNKLLEFLQNSSKKYFQSIKQINLGGEQLSPILLEKAQKFFKNKTFYNFYGPTEFTINALCHKISNNRNYNEVPIGKALKGVKFFIKKNDQKENSGELLLAGKQIMIGYVNYKSKFSFINKKKYYPTGDIVKLNSKKEVIFVGRKGEYIKLEGYRINISRIENIIEKKLKKNIKLVINNSKINLIVELKKINSKNIILAKLNKIFSDFLEHYERPNQIKFLKKFNYLENGKLDIKKFYN